jgi:hypothetical protein
MTFNIVIFCTMTFNRITFDTMAFNIVTFCTMTLNRITFDKMTFSIANFNEIAKYHKEFKSN